ncbi:MAG: TonB-dependent receptor, partial [Pacificimonas sp.]
MKAYLLCAATLCIASSLHAQEKTPPGNLPVDDITATGNAPPDGRIASYAPAEFSRFSPNTALDMVRQIPGFILERADEKRGLGQGGANVLINGRRISGKSNDAVDELGRIAATDVVRLDIVEGTS